MKYTYLEAFGWHVVYLMFVLSPLGLMVSGPEQEARGFWVEFGVALGFTGLSMMCMQFFITGRFRDLGMGFGSDNLLHFHTAAGVVGMLLVLSHPAILLWAEDEYAAYLDPRVNLPRVAALVTATIAVVFLVVLSLFRKSFRLMYEAWRLSHGILASIVVLIGLVHILQVGHHSVLWWQKGYVILFVGGSFASVLHVRLVRPLRLKKRPYRITEVIPERAGGTTLVMEAQGHSGMDFQAGQYAWITVGESPFSLQQHPFSFSSPADDCKRIAFTSKPIGDFTSTWREISVGQTAYLEGPYGAFTLRKKRRKLIFIAGGVGVTPVMSMLRTLEDRRDTREIRLIYANKRWEEVMFREEVERMQSTLNLEVTHVLSDPEPEWEGLSGYVTHEILGEILPENLEEFDVYICGPEPMMNLVEGKFSDSDLPLPRINSERFQIV